MTRVALDTNILAYAEGLRAVPADEPKIAVAQRLLRRLIEETTAPVAPVQALAELHHLLRRKAGLSGSEAAARLARLRAAIEPAATTPGVFDAAMDLAEAHGLQTFDAVILAAAVEARCDLLLSEDLKDGFAWRGLVVCNPFGPSPDRRVARLLEVQA